MTTLTVEKLDMWRDVVDSEAMRYCYACGSCISDCPASRADPPLLIRRLIRMVALGLEDELLDDDTPWACVTCSRCEEVCPMDVRPFELCLAIRRWQCRQDGTRIPLSTPEVFQRGYTQPVEKVGALRASVWLTEPVPAITNDSDLLAKFQAMLLGIGLIRDNDYMFKG